MARLEMALTAPEYGIGVTPLSSTHPATVGYYQIFDYTYSIAGAIGGNAVMDTFNRTVASGWGTADTGQAWSILGGVATDYDVTPSTGGQIVMNTTAGRIAYLSTVQLANANVLVQVTPTVTATGGTLGQAAMVRSDGTGANEYTAFLIWNTNGTVDLSVQKRVASVTTILSTLVNIGTYTPGAAWWIRFDVTGTTLSARAWREATTEPGAYQIVITDTSLTTGAVGVRAFRAAGNTNVAAALNYDNFSVGNLFTDAIRALYFAPQRFGENWTVERVTVNDTSKGQVPAVYVMRGLVRPDTAFNIAAIQFPHQPPTLLATSQLVDYTPAGTNDVADITSPIHLSPGEYFSVLFAGSKFPDPGTIESSTVFVGGETTR